MKWVLNLLPKTEIDDECNDGKGLLMTRYYLTPKIFGLRLVIHQFHRSDNDRHYHDHPWNFISWILKGSYIEHYPIEQLRADISPSDMQQAHRRWDIIKRPKTWKHWVELRDNSWCYECGEYIRRLKSWELEAHKSHTIINFEFEECWTLVLLYGKRRDWGFWTEQGWVYYKNYDCRGDYVSDSVQHQQGNSESD